MEGAPPVRQIIAPRIRALVLADRACIYGVRRAADGLRLDFLHAGDYPSAQLAGDMERVLRTSPTGWGPFDPARVPVAQRNRPFLVDRLVLDASKQRSPSFRAMLERHASFDGREQLRILVCDGPTLVAWVGAFHERFGWRDAALLRRIAPALVNRLQVEHRLATGELALAALDAALENLPGAALVIDSRGDPVHANAAARLLLAGGRQSIRAASADVARGRPQGRFRSLRLSSRGCADHFLLLELASRPDAVIAAGRIAARLELTRRQREVLTSLSSGKPNKAIAADLGVAEATVEFHVTALLARTGCRSRAELVATIWGGGSRS